MTKEAASAIETLRAWYATRSPDLLADDVEWTVLARFPSGGVYHGRDQVFDVFFPAIADAFPLYAVEVEEIWPTDRDEVIATGAYVARRSADGPEIRARFAHIWTIRAGRITRFRHVVDTAAFLEAA